MKVNDWRGVARRLRDQTFGRLVPVPEPAAPPPEVPQLYGNVDAPVPGGVVRRGPVVVRGWHRCGDKPAVAVMVSVNGQVVGRSITGAEARPDVALVTGIPALVDSGWNVVVDLEDVPDDTAEISVTVWGAVDQSPVRVDPIAVRVVAPGEGQDDQISAPADQFFGNLDMPRKGEMVERDVLRVVGWAITDLAPVEKVEVLINGHNFGSARLGLERPDVRQHHRVPHALVAGFEHLIDLRDLPGDDRIVTIAIVARTAIAGPTEIAERSFVVTTPKVSKRDRARDHLIRRRSDLLLAGEPPLADGDLKLIAFTHDMGYGGGQLWLSELLYRAGAGRSFECTVVAPKDGPLVGDLEKMGIEVHVTQDYPVRDLEAYEGRVAELGLWTRNRGHNAALVNTFGAFIGADIASRMGIPLVWAIHESWSPSVFWSVAYPPGYVDPAVRLAAERAFRLTNALVFEAEATRRQYDVVVRKGHSLVVPYGVDVDAIERYRNEHSRTAARRACGLPDDSRVLLVMGTTEPRKAQTLLAEAFAEVSSRHRDAVLVFVGDTENAYADALKAFIEQSGIRDQTMVVPIVEDTYQWYRAADALVCASDVESLPRSVLEAMCFGLPILSTAVFGLSELLTDGEAGFLFDPCDLRAARDALLRLLGAGPGQLVNMGAVGRRLVLEHHDSRGYAADIVRLLEGFRHDPGALPADLLPPRDRTHGPMAGEPS